MNEFLDLKSTNQTYRQLSQRTNMSWPERQEVLELEKIKLLKMAVSHLERLVALVSAKAEDKGADKSQPRQAQPQSKP